MTRHTPLTRILGGLGAASFAAGLALAAPGALARDGGHGSGHDGGHDHGHHGNAPSHLDLPNGFRPEGIATGRHHTAYLGSLADGDIYALDLRSGEGEVISEGPGTPSVGLKLKHGLLFVSGGSSGTARVVGVAERRGAGDVHARAAGTPSFINDVVLTHDAAWFTDSLDNAVYRIPLGHHHGHRSLPGQDDVQKIDLTGAWVQGTGNNANGISTTPDGRALLVINSSNGLLYRVDDDGVATQVDLGGYVVTNGDGLLREGRTLYAVQNRLNKVAVFKLDKKGTSGELRDTLTSPDFDVPTTIARSGGDLYLPNARFTTPPTPTTAYWVTGIEDSSGH